MKVLCVIAVLVGVCVALPPAKKPFFKFPHAFPPFPAPFKPHALPHFPPFKGFPHAKPLFPHGKGFPFSPLHPGFPFPFLGLGGFGPLGTFDGSCPFYTTPQFIEQIEDQISEEEGRCDIAGCTLAPHVSVSLSACAPIRLVSVKSPKGAIRDIPVAQPEGNSEISVKCEHGILSLDGFNDGAAEAGVLVIDQEDCYPCRFYSSAPEVLAAIKWADDGSSCDDKGLCDLVPGADIKVHAWPGAGYDLTLTRDFASNEWVSVPSKAFSFQLQCSPGGMVWALGFEQQSPIEDVMAIQPNNPRKPFPFPFH